MLKYKSGKKGIALFMVLATVLVVVVLANVTMALISSQNRFTHHEVSRIQAYYAGRAGIVYAMEQLRNGTWTFNPNTCPPGFLPSLCLVTDAGFAPYVVNNQVEVVFCAPGNTCGGIACPAGIPARFCLQTFVNYTYSP